MSEPAIKAAGQGTKREKKGAEVPCVKAPWLGSYDEEVPATLTYSEKTMVGALEDTARRDGDYIAYD